MARFECTPAKAAALLSKIEALQERAALQEQERSLVDGRRILIAQSSGTVKTKTLRAMGHPFARRAPQTPMNAAMINDQGGPFKKSWKKSAPRRDGDHVTSRVVNTDHKARFMHGTDVMVERPIIAAVKRQLLPIRRKRHRLFLNREIAKEMKN